MNSARNIPIGSMLLLTVITLWFGVIAAPAQNVPSNTRETAALPQYAARLAHRDAAQHKLPPRNRGLCGSTLRTSGGKRTSPQDILYSNGPINGTVIGWTINFGFGVADSFTIANGDTTTGLTFGAWLFPGDVLQSVEVSVTSAHFGGTSYLDQVVSFTQSGCFSNGGFNICTETGFFNGLALIAGTYWVNLQNAVVNNGDPVYWDQNSGPSLAAQSSLGTIPSESFSINGSLPPPPPPPPPSNNCMPEQDGFFNVIHDFSGNLDGGAPSGVAADTAGNVYGPTGYYGDNGSVYKLAQAGSGWVLSTLYNFLGGSNGSAPAGVTVGHSGILYGSANGGIENCVSGGFCGFIFGLRPTPTTCSSTSCSWKENAVYNFTGTTDSWQGSNLVSDPAGNLYGVSHPGGAQQLGAVFELSPSIGGWTESILYSFTGGGNGSGPNEVIVGHDGNLYGTADAGGAFDGGVVFELTPTSNGWTETVIYNIPNESYMGSNPHSLVQDSAGNLFGIYEYSICCANTDGLIYMLSPSNGSWVFTELYHGDESLDGDDVFPNMVLDSQGNLFGTGSAYSGCMNSVSYGYIFELSPGKPGWHFNTPESWSYTYFPSTGSLALDSRGNLYGTTNFCGTQDAGTVWQFMTQ